MTEKRIVEIIAQLSDKEEYAEVIIGTNEILELAKMALARKLQVKEEQKTKRKEHNEWKIV